MHTIIKVHGFRVLTVDDGVTLGGESDAVELIGHAFGEEAAVVVVPAGLVDERFFELRTRVAGGGGAQVLLLPDPAGDRR